VAITSCRNQRRDINEGDYWWTAELTTLSCRLIAEESLCCGAMEGCRWAAWRQSDCPPGWSPFLQGSQVTGVWAGGGRWGFSEEWYESVILWKFLKGTTGMTLKAAATWHWCLYNCCCWDTRYEGIKVGNGTYVHPANFMGN